MARGIGAQAKLSVCDTLAGVYEQKLERRPFIVPGSYDILNAVKHDIISEVNQCHRKKNYLPLETDVKLGAFSIFVMHAW